MKTVFLRVMEAPDKAAALLKAIREPEAARGKRRFEVDPESFTSVPCSPFPYWVSNNLRLVFAEFPPLEAYGRTARQGLATADDFRWLRLSWESHIPKQDRYWTPFTKGGAHSSYYADVGLCVAWSNSGRDLKEWKAEKLRLRLITPNNSKCWNEHHYFRPGLTWSQRSQIGLSLRAMPAQGIFGKNGPAIFVKDDDYSHLLSLLAIVNSKAFRALVSMQMAFGSYEVGVIQRTPIPPFTESNKSDLARPAHRAWSLKRSLDTPTQTSHSFTLPALLQVAGADLQARAAAWSKRLRSIGVELNQVQAEIDACCFGLYGIDEADRRMISEGFGSGSSDEPEVGEANDTEDDAAEDTDENDSAADAASLAAELVSWAVGTAFGRFDIRLATGMRLIPTEPEPFDPLPTCSPGKLTGDDGLPLARPPVGYPLAFPEAGVLVDDPGHTADLTAAVRTVFDAVFAADVDRWWNDVATLLDPKDYELRVWLADSFFEYHLKRYSKSRRKAPILWQLGTPSGRYSVWLYAHRLTRDSLLQLQNDVVGPKLIHEERQLTNLTQKADDSPSASERKAIAAQETVVEELRAMLDEVTRVAPLWNPNLDDGVVLTMAPLWRLVAQCKPWQKELKAKWGELSAGKYDWAHIAMHLWPERVIPKCATDRSLAIAHGLEDIFWVEDLDGKWNARTTPVKPLDEFIRERSSPAVKAALNLLLDAPAIIAAQRRSGAARMERSV
jgi:hypothetical protein